MNKALVVGIDYYTDVGRLYGCVNDAYGVKSALDTNYDGTRNFGVKLLISLSDDTLVDKNTLKDNIEELFKDDSDIALFYFSGHGYVESTGGYLVTSECNRGDNGLSLNDLMTIVNNSPAKNKIIVLDCCHSGAMGNLTISAANSFVSINEGVTILTASTSEQYATEEDGAGLFTSLFIDGLNGGASNLLGDITPGSIYAHIDQSLGAWSQRPMFKTNVKNFTVIRKVSPSISLMDLKEIVNLFESIGEAHELDPSYEPDSNKFNEENGEKFSILQKYNRVNLVVPIGEEHMYYAAMNSKSCKLTVLGEFYWKLVKKEVI